MLHEGVRRLENKNKYIYIHIIVYLCKNARRKNKNATRINPSRSKRKKKPTCSIGYKNIKMYKEKTVQKEIIERPLYCDVCGMEIKHTLACMKATCEYCKNDLCENCIGYEEETGTDNRVVWCKRCWDLGTYYRPKIKELNEKKDRLINEWQERCKNPATSH